MTLEVQGYHGPRSSQHSNQTGRKLSRLLSVSPLSRDKQ